MGEDSGSAYVFQVVPPFVRGDCNADGSYNIADAINVLNILFTGRGISLCRDACDANDDGAINIADAIYVLGDLFNNGRDPAPPFPDCGDDFTDDSLNCLSFPSCL